MVRGIKGGIWNVGDGVSAQKGWRWNCDRRHDPPIKTTNQQPPTVKTGSAPIFPAFEITSLIKHKHLHQIPDTRSNTQEALVEPKLEPTSTQNTEIGGRVGGVTDALLRRITTLDQSRTDWPPLNKLLHQDTTAATEQIRKRARLQV